MQYENFYKFIRILQSIYFTASIKKALSVITMIC